MHAQAINERRQNHLLRRVILLGNALSMWAGITATTSEESKRLGDLLDAWDNALADVRKENKNKSL